MSGRLCDHEKSAQKKSVLAGLMLTACSYALLAFFQRTCLAVSFPDDRLVLQQHFCPVSLYTMVVDESGEDNSQSRKAVYGAKLWWIVRYDFLLFCAVCPIWISLLLGRCFSLEVQSLTLYGVWNAAKKNLRIICQRNRREKAQNLKLAICKSKSWLLCAFAFPFSQCAGRSICPDYDAAIWK